MQSIRLSGASSPNPNQGTPLKALPPDPSFSYQQAVDLFRLQTYNADDALAQEARRRVERRFVANSIAEWSEVCSEADSDVVATALKVRLVFDQLAVRRTQAARTSHHAITRNATPKNV